MSGPPQTEAEEIIAALERIGLNVLGNLQATRRDAELAGKDYKRNPAYKGYAYELDGIAEGLANALWIHRWYGREVARGTELPSTYQGIHHLHGLQAKKKKKQKT